MAVGREAREERFTWSTSRKRLYDECPRAYYFRYYGARDGWSPSAPPLARALYILRHVKGRHVWAGNVVHETVEDLLRKVQRGDPGFLSADWVIHEMLARRLRPEWKASRDGRYIEEPKKHTGLLEHHYGYHVSREEWKRIAESAKTAVRNFLQSEFWQLAHNLVADDWLLLEDLESFELDGVRVWVRCDFVYRDAGGKVVVVDWKTGRRLPKPRNLQLGCYGIFAAERWGLDPSALRVVEMNLTRGIWAEAEIGKGEMSKTREEILTSIHRLRELLVDPETNRARQEDFRPKPRRVSCFRCPFLEACPDGQEIVPLHGGGRLKNLMGQGR